MGAAQIDITVPNPMKKYIGDIRNEMGLVNKIKEGFVSMRHV